MRARMRRPPRLVSSIPRVVRATPLDYDAILARLQAGSPVHEDG